MSFTKKIKRRVSLFVSFIKNPNKSRRLKKIHEIEDYFMSQDNNTDDPEIIEIIDYFKKHQFSVFPYDFSQRYNMHDIAVFYDKDANSRYVLHDNKRLYFPKKWKTDRIQSYYSGLLAEQDKDSPHCYQTDMFSVEQGYVIADVGAAEGIWALNCAEQADKIYLFECNSKWIEALYKTFEPWKEKVVIVDRYVSNTDDKTHVSLDHFFENEKIDLIKADIEGMETEMLEGSKNLLACRDNLKLLICTYHRHNDAAIKNLLTQYGFKTEYSKKYMLFIYDKQLEAPYVRRGLIRAMK